MAQYLVAIHHPDNYDPSTEGEAMMHDIGVLNEEMEAAGARVFAGGLVIGASREIIAQAAWRRCCSSPMDRTWKPRSTSVVSGFWKRLTWTRHWRGVARP